jgi:hypothetical protein
MRAPVELVPQSRQHLRRTRWRQCARPPVCCVSSICAEISVTSIGAVSVEEITYVGITESRNHGWMCRGAWKSSDRPRGGRTSSASARNGASRSALRRAGARVNCHIRVNCRAARVNCHHTRPPGEGRGLEVAGGPRLDRVVRHDDHAVLRRHPHVADVLVALHQLLVLCVHLQTPERNAAQPLI